MKNLLSEIRRVVSQLVREEAASRARARAIYQRPEYCAESYQRPAYLRRAIVVRRRGEHRWAMEQEAWH